MMEIPTSFLAKVAKCDICLKVQCLKITEKVSFNVASQASYVYILSGQKFIKNAKIVDFGDCLFSIHGQTSHRRKLKL